MYATLHSLALTFYAERLRCAAGAAPWLREPTGACLLAVGTNALLGNQPTRSQDTVEDGTELTEGAATQREGASVMHSTVLPNEAT